MVFMSLVRVSHAHIDIYRHRHTLRYRYTHRHTLRYRPIYIDINIQTETH